MTTTNRDAAVVCHQLEKVYQGPGGGVAALQGVNLTVATSEVVAIMGASGSGKSTLLHLLGAIDSPTRGQAIVLGEEVGTLSGFARTLFRRKRVGFVFQQFHLVPTLTALEQIELPMRYAGVGRSERLARAAALLSEVGLADRAEHLPAALSGGEQQRVAIVRAMANEPGVLLADEPTGNLDHDKARGVIDLLLQARATRGVAVLIVTHDPAVAERTDRIVRLKDGRVQA